MTGHAMGAAGAIESFVCVKAIADRLHPADDQPTGTPTPS